MPRQKDFIFEKAPRRAASSGWQASLLVCARELPGGRARALALLLVLARRHRGGSRSCLRAAGLAAARRDWQLVCSLRPAVRSCGAARAGMLGRAPPGPPPGDGLSARRWHTGLGASAPLLVRQTSCAGTAACNALAHCTCRSSKLRCVRSGGLEPNAYTLLSRSYSNRLPCRLRVERERAQRGRVLRVFSGVWGGGSRVGVGGHGRWP